jgi:hypothetical protein
VTRFALLACLASCSLLVVRGPDPARPGQCTEQAITPIAVDVALGVAAAATSAVLIDNHSATQHGEELAIGIGAIPLAVLFLISAAAGYSRTQDCKNAKTDI